MNSCHSLLCRPFWLKHSFFSLAEGFPSPLPMTASTKFRKKLLLSWPSFCSARVKSLHWNRACWWCHTINCLLFNNWYPVASPAEEWKRREVKFSQKWSRDRVLGTIAQFVQCSKNFFSLGCSTSSTLFPTLPSLHSNSYNTVLLNMQVIVQPLHKFLAGIWCCDKSTNLLFHFCSDKFVLSWSKIEHTTVVELYWNYWIHTSTCNLIPLFLLCDNSVRIVHT